jgi:hypothetical protein
VGFSWLRLKWFVLVGYLLIWVPWIMLLSRPSQQPEILGRWSPRAFAFLVAAGISLVLARWSVLQTCFGRSRYADVLDTTLTRIRRSSYLWWLALAIL